MEKTAVDVLREAYEHRTIGKEEYESAVEKILKNEVGGKKTGKEIFLGEFRIVERNGRVEIAMENGNIKILDSGGIAGGGAGIPAVDESRGESDLKEDKTTGVDITDDMKKIEDPPEDMDWEETKTRRDVLMDEIKSEIELIDLKREFEQEEDGGGEENEEGEEETPGILDNVIARFKKVTLEDREEKLKRMALQNLEGIKGIKNERKATIGAAYVLKEFLQVKFKISSELTYREMIYELKTEDINHKLKNQLIEFFKEMSIMAYAPIAKKDNFSRYYSLAKKTITELGGSDALEK